MTSTPTPRLTLVISTLDGGGGARAMCNLANRWAELGRQVSLITLTEASTDFYFVHPQVDRIGLGVGGESRHALESVAANGRRIRILRRAIRQTEPDALVAFMDRTNVLTLMATAGLEFPVIVCEQIDPRAYPIPPVWALLRLITYRLADAVVLLSPEQLPWAARRWGSRKTRVIPNPGPPASLPSGRSKESRPDHSPGSGEICDSLGLQAIPHDRQVLLAIGRLVPQKGFDLLLTGFARLATRHPDWDLVILGEGPDRTSLETLMRRLGIEKRVRLLGHVSDVASWLERADLFVLSSRFEGFPNALLEAMAAGLPVVSFDCPTGPAQIINDGGDGLLVPPEDVDAIVAALGDLMTDDQKRSKLGSSAAQSVQRFSLDKIIPLWDELIDELLAS